MPVHVDHGDLDQIGGAALDGRVDGGAFGKGAHVVVTAVDFRQQPDTPQQGAGAAAFARLGDGFVDKAIPPPLIPGNKMVEIQRLSEMSGIGYYFTLWYVKYFTQIR